jgi:hypothetical protein
MFEVFQHPEHIPLWRAAVGGRDPDWASLYRNYVATVDWPGAAFWRPLSEAYPDALVLLSVRESTTSWFHSVDLTINELMRRSPAPQTNEWHTMASDLLRATFAPVPFDEAAAKMAYERHNAAVRAAIPRARLLEWEVGDDWAPLCERLRVPVPGEPFPHVNTTEEYRFVLDRVPERPSWSQRARRVLRR